MRYLILLFLSLFLISCTPLSFYPYGGDGRARPYIHAIEGRICHRCHKKATLLKLDNKGRLWCKECYEKLYP